MEVDKYYNNFKIIMYVNSWQKEYVFLEKIIVELVTNHIRHNNVPIFNLKNIVIKLIIVDFFIQKVKRDACIFKKDIAKINKIAWWSMFKMNSIKFDLLYLIIIVYIRIILF